MNLSWADGPLSYMGPASLPLYGLDFSNLYTGQGRAYLTNVIVVAAIPDWHLYSFASDLGSYELVLILFEPFKSVK